MPSPTTSPTARGSARWEVALSGRPVSAVRLRNLRGEVTRIL